MKIFMLSITILGCARAARRFPDEFQFGVATSSHQIEGAWNVSGKGEDMWDYFSHKHPYTVKDRSNADITSDSYHNYKRDVEMMRELGLDSYRFSLSWPRILPDGVTVNEDGITFYNNYINEMIKYGIKPMVTLCHDNIPMALMWKGGLVNRKFGEWFENYARVAFDNFGDRVKFWITFNEPSILCAPSAVIPGMNLFGCAKSLLLAHARVYHLYKAHYRSQGGECGITFLMETLEPLTDTEENRRATELVAQVEWGLYCEPIFSQAGGFPKTLSEAFAETSKRIGHSSFVPEFTDDEKAFVRGTADFFGINQYSGRMVYTKNKNYSGRSATDIRFYRPSDWLSSGSDYMKLVPYGLYKVLMDMHQKYNHTKFYITENGWPTRPGIMEDDDRITYIRAALDDILDCLDAGVDVRGYSVWSLMDTFEWINGYTLSFGLYAVDFEDPKRTRTPRKSAFVYKEIVRSRVVDHNYQPANRTMWIDEGH